MASKRQILIGGVPIGGGAQVAVRTMTKTETANVGAMMDQIHKVAEAPKPHGVGRAPRHDRYRRPAMQPS